MRKLVVVGTLLLAGTGLLIVFAHLPDPVWGLQKAVVLAHIWAGVVYLVIFPLYAWDHIRTNRRWLTRRRALTFSGLSQLTAAVLLILTGIVLLLYGGQIWRPLRQVHHWLTYPLLAALAWHYLSPKAWRPATGEKQAGPGQKRADPGAAAKPGSRAVG